MKVSETTTTSFKHRRARIAAKRTIISVIEVKHQKINIQEPLLISIGELADELGYKVYIVGGFVRDYYLNNPRNDYDFTVIGDALTFAKKVAKKFKSKAVLYEKFMTAMVPIGDIKCEFVGTRKEEYLPDSRKPIVTVGTLEDDLKRRDFTINAIAVAINENNFGDVIDLFQGKRDIDLRILRTPLEPSTTFSEDPLRMMRCARFASQLNFSLDRSCIEAARKIANRIQIISQERISDEFLKILNSDVPSVGINLLREMGLLEYIFPELMRLTGVEIISENGRDFNHKDVYIHTLRVLDNVASQSNNTWLRFAALLHDIAKSITKEYVPGTGWTFHGHEEHGARQVEKIFRRMKLPLVHVEYVEKLVRLHQRPMALVDEGVTDSAVRRLAFQAGDALEDLFLLCKSDITTNNPKLSQRYLRNYEIVKEKVILIQEKDKLREFQSPVRGEEIMDMCGLKPSKTVGLIKTAIEEAILDGIIQNDYDAAKEYFLQHKDKWLNEFNNPLKETILI